MLSVTGDANGPTCINTRKKVPLNRIVILESCEVSPSSLETGRLSVRRSRVTMLLPVAHKCTSDEMSRKESQSDPRIVRSPVSHCVDS